MTIPADDALRQGCAEGALVLEPLAERHRAALRTACAEESTAWHYFSIDWSPAGFDASFDALLADPARIPFTILHDGTLIGMTAWIGLHRGWQVVEIGNTYLRPAARGTGLNDRIKRLLLNHAFAHGIRRVTFSVADRNARSKAAMAKIGGVLEGILRSDRITWTGHIRDSALFSILAGEWRG